MDDLRRGLKSYPREPQLGLQLAHGLSTARQDVDWHSVDEIIDRVESWAGDAGGPSPRRVYGAPSTVELQAAASRIEARIRPLLPRLVESVALLPDGDPPTLRRQRDCRVLLRDRVELPAEDVAGDR